MNLSCGRVNSTVRSLKAAFETSAKIKVTLSRTSMSVYEGASSSFEIHLDKAADVDLPFSLASSDGGSLDSRILLLPSNANLKIPAGQTGVTVTLTVSDDSIYQGSKNVGLLVSTNNASVELVSPVLTLTINDDESPPTVSFTSATATVGEASGAQTAAIQLNHASQYAVTVNYSFHGGVVAGQATSGTDFTGVDGSVIFAPGETTKTIGFTIMDDAFLEANETFTLTLDSVSSGANLGAVLTKTVTIMDDESPNFAILGVTGGTDSTVDAILSSTLNPTVHWGAIVGVTSYDVQIFSNAAGTTSVCGPQSTASNSLALSSCTLVAGTTYYLSVIANPGAVAAANNLFSFVTNRNPTVVDDGPVYMMTGETVSISVLANDSDADGDTLTLTSVSAASLGTSSVVGSQVRYVASTAPGSETLSYSVSDGRGGVSSGNLTVFVMTPFTWTGAVSTSWDNATSGNWCGAINTARTGCVGSPAVPDSTSDVVIDSTCASANCAVHITDNVTVKSVSLQTNSLSQNSGKSLTIVGSGFTQRGGTFVGSDADIATTNFTVQSGTFTSTSAVLQIANDTSVANAATFNHNLGTLRVNENSSVNFNLNSHHLQNFEIQGTSGYGVTFASPVVVEGDLTGFASSTSYNGSSIEIWGNLTMSGSGVSSTEFLLKGSGAQTVTCAAGATIPNLRVNATGTVTYSGRVEIAGDYLYQAGTLVTTGSIVKFAAPGANPKSASITPGSPHFANVEIGNSGGWTRNVTGTLFVDGSLVIDGSLQGGAIETTGDVTSQNSEGGSTVLKFVGVNQTLTGSNKPLPNVLFAVSGVLSFVGTVDFDGDVIWQSGSLNAGTSVVVLSGARAATVNLASESFYDLTVDNSVAGFGRTVVGSLNVLRNFSMSSGHLVGGGSVSVGGNVSLAAGIQNDLSLVLIGSSAQSINVSGGTYLGGSIVSANSGSTVTLLTDLILSATQNLTVASGTLDMNAKSLNVGGTLTINAGAVLTQNGGTLTTGTLVNNGTLNP